jgi:signal transduction histidine kinase
MPAAPAKSIVEYIRSQREQISESWQREVLRELPQLAALSQATLYDHLAELLEGLAAWIEGHEDDAERAFTALAEGHAVQRLGFGIEIDVLVREYAVLRRVLLQHLLAVATPGARAELVRLDDAMDRVVAESLRRYGEERDHLRERFIAILAHDLRNPLSVILPTMDLLLDAGLDEQHASLLLPVRRAVERMSRMITEVLDFARGHLGGGIPSVPTPNDLGALCESAADEVRGAHPDREVLVTKAGDLRGAFDRDRVIQALSNLLGNAVAYGTGPIRIAAREAPDRKSLETVVSSAGPVIPPDVRRRIFRPFQRGVESGHGLGLGLFIVQQIALAHGGLCEVESDDASTRFHIRWPRTPLEETPSRPTA